MHSLTQALWIKPPEALSTTAPLYRKTFELCKPVREATLTLTARGVYVATLNGSRVGDFILAPGWTNYHHRVQYQSYAVTQTLSTGNNSLDITVGSGWYASRISQDCYTKDRHALIAALFITYVDGTTDTVLTGPNWQVTQSAITFNDIYDGETFDATHVLSGFLPVEVAGPDEGVLIAQEGEVIREQEVLSPIACLMTPKGETVLDFGQNLTGYVRFCTHARQGDIIELSHCEILDQDGNFYTENYRSSKSSVRYICREGENHWQPLVTFYGFRYVRIDSFPKEVDPAQFEAVVVHSSMQRTGHFASASSLLNSLYQNALWSQKDNYLDIPTDCPQRDERVGWTGDAQIFIKAAAYNYDIQRFFRKWLRDMASEQNSDGAIPAIIPFPWRVEQGASAAWGDAATICPWELYLAYGDKAALLEHLPMMEKWIAYIQSCGSEEGLWDSGDHYADWLGLDAEEGSYKGKTDQFLIATAYYHHSVGLVARTRRALSLDASAYEALLPKIEKAFASRFIRDSHLTSDTQTAYAVCLHFGLCPAYQTAFADRLATLVNQSGVKITTGFVGSPYILHALSDNGHHALAVSLLLREAYPSWLYPVTRGATTIWEHWDGLKPDGSLWSAEMNSFNHYAYGAVVDFLYGVLCGIKPDERAPGYRHILISPRPDARLGFAEASLDTRYGRICSGWVAKDGAFHHTIDIPAGCTADITIGGTTHHVSAGRHEFVCPCA